MDRGGARLVRSAVEGAPRGEGLTAGMTQLQLEQVQVLRQLGRSDEARGLERVSHEGLSWPWRGFRRGTAARTCGVRRRRLSWRS